ncbi:hypothetical protein J2W32_005222 [Variovorax boronicumulans]|uniref:DUF3348 domain-containing protein n=1 Tax=Variovorax boronicumulans TaxID=436515 RepID=A0AAW8CXU9_9BURK|nr:DUF3348 domain-containing protein [Variovorax boronicumulans]MDP9896233.1 hypothetical protein [Variovorax boronicumulans]MDQ0056154.1 hypothetical protein [Variovorax boronicumulans]
MVQVSRRTGFTGSALIRLLARLADIEVPEPKQAFADRLSQWLGWTDAISLSAALNGGLAASSSGARAAGNPEARECERVRTAMTNAIAEDMHSASRDNTTDFAAYRRRYHARQQAMQTSIGPLRGRLRSTLATRSPDMARLAAVDVVMEQVLSAQEHRLLGSIPAMLEKHFKRLGQADANLADSDAEPGAWLPVFRKDMHDVLLAEMEIRFQPVEGLLEALRAS